MAEVVFDAGLNGDGEPFFVVHIDKPRGVGGTVVGELTLEQVGPVSAEIARPRRLIGFELPALATMHLAGERAHEKGVTKILLVDPQGLLPLAKANRYARRR